MEPTYHFPDDKAESFDAYRGTPPLWLSVAEYTRVAADAYKLTVSRQTTERWLRMLTYLYVLDQMLDDEYDRERRSTAREIIETSLRGDAPTLPEWISPHVRYAHDLVWSSIQDLGDQGRAALNKAGRLGLLAAERKADASTVREHLKAIRLENCALADLTAELMKLQERQDAIQKFRMFLFRAYLRRLYTHFGVQDALEDMESDWKNGLVKVELTEANSRRLRNAYRRSILHLLLRFRVTARVIWRGGELSRSNTHDRWKRWQQQVTI